MKQRATIICTRGEQVLLVATDRVRWALPGGKIEAGETPLDCAIRELAEETSLRSLRLDFLFEFGGTHKLHHVFSTEVPAGFDPQPGREISRCHWFAPTHVSTIIATASTRQIISLHFSRT